MKQTRNPQSEMNTANERLGQAFYSSRRYNPPLIAVAGVGFIAIYLLTLPGVAILGEAAPSLLFIGLLTLLFALSEMPILTLAQENKGIAAYLYSTAVGGLYAILVTFLWQVFLPIGIVIAAITPVLAIRAGIPRRYYARLLLLLLGLVLGIMVANAVAPAAYRLQSSHSASISSLVFLFAIASLLITIAIISQTRRFRSLQGLLLTSFVIIVTIPTAMTTVLSAIGAYTNNQTQTFNSLEAITTLKVNQVETLLGNSQNDTKTLLSDSRFMANALGILTASSDLNPILARNYKQIARSRMVDVLGTQDEAYNEIMVLNTQGTVVISTMPTTEGINFQNQPFFQKGLLRFYAAFVEETSFGTDNLVIAAPIFDLNRQDMRGVLVLRSNGAFLKEIMENTPGFSEAETYLVNLSFKPVTKTLIPIDRVDSQAAQEAIVQGTAAKKDIYSNYAGQPVLGYYHWFQPMELAVIAEVPLNFVIRSSLNSLMGSGILVLFVVAAAIIAVIIAARTITDPIATLVHTTESFAAGNLSARAAVDRADEIGTLAQAYNQMTVQLQDMIGKLEQRVENRTRDLEGQTLRLRVAAEIARDAASARDLHELLTQSGRLIQNRFGFYHTGIFLLDNDKEYAVLVASPTEAGQQMLANSHKLRVGAAGIVGRVAASGEARVTLNTGMDAVYFNNPFLPNTKSEMALPLKAENRVIGVLDVQSDQPEAFNDDDVAIMQILADQLAIAIERARLLEELEISLRELESAYGRFTTENWRKSSSGSLMTHKGYRFDNIRVEPVAELPDLADNVLKTGIRVVSNGNTSGVDKEHKAAVPIKLRGQTIGVVTLKLKEDYDISTISTIELAVERLATAMESARLYEETRLRADREQSISRVTSAIGASTDYEQILQNTVREIGSILGDTEVAIQILDEPTAGKRAEPKEQ